MSFLRWGTLAGICQPPEPSSKESSVDMSIKQGNVMKITRKARVCRAQCRYFMDHFFGFDSYQVSCAS